MAVNDLVAMLQVADVEKAMAFYRDVLGFELVSPQAVFEQDGVLFWCSMKAGKAQMMLARRDGGAPMAENKQGPGDTIFYIYSDDVMAMHASLKAKAIAVSDPRVTFYQMKEIQLEDPDGHTIWVAQHTDEAPTACE